MYSKRSPIFLSNIVASVGQKVTAWVIVAIMLVMFGALVPFAQVPGPIYSPFPPVGDAVLGVMYFVIGFLIVGQFLRLHTWSLLCIASGFFFVSTATIIHMLSFPGFVLNDNLTPWLYVVWRGGFPPFVIAYAYFHGLSRLPMLYWPRLAMTSAAIAAIGLAVLGMLVVMYYETSLAFILPFGIVGTGFVPAIIGLNLISLFLLWLRGNSILDIWLMVATCSALLDIIMSTVIGARRFDVSFYVGRGFGLLSASLILGALLNEMNRLYARIYAVVETQQKESDAKYRAVFDTTIDAIIVVDRQGMIKSFNRAAEHMFGYTANETDGHNMHMLIPEPYSKDQQNFHAIIGAGREVQGKRKDGAVIAIDLAVSEWQSADNEQLFTSILRDITARKHIEKQLVQSQKMEAIGHLTGGMAHDFNNLLGVIIGNLDMLAEQFPHGTPEELTDAITASMAGAELVQRLLAFARRQPLQPKVMYLNEVVENLIPLLRRIIEGHIEVVTIYDPTLLPIIADPGQFENAAFNLVVNARDAMPNGGTITIECRSVFIDEHSAVEYDVPCGQYATLIVSDTGVGIPKEILPLVFDPFFTTKGPGQGSGLGLSMVFGYAKQSGGLIRIYSEVGKGTNVRLYFPTITDAEARNGHDKIEVDTNSFHGSERILIVEDTQAARIVAERILVSLGYTVRSAQNASEAMLIINSGEVFDMLFTDMIMPGMDGIALAHEVRKQHPLIKVLFASGFSLTPAKDILELGATYITKPYRKIDIASMLRNIFDQHTD